MFKAKENKQKGKLKFQMNFMQLQNKIIFSTILLSESSSGGEEVTRTSSLMTSPLTLLAMLADLESLEASLIRVTRKFLHFFTLSIVS